MFSPCLFHLPAAAAVDVADVPLLLPFNTLVSTLSSSSFSDSETQKLLEIVSDKAGADTWQLVQPHFLFCTRVCVFPHSSVSAPLPPVPCTIYVQLGFHLRYMQAEILQIICRFRQYATKQQIQTIGLNDSSDQSRERNTGQVTPTSGIILQCSSLPTVQFPFVPFYLFIFVALSLCLQASQKGDPLAALKKQLEEKDKLLSAEQENAAASKTRIRELTKVSVLPCLYPDQ